MKIISTAPTRLSLFGGGTDVEPYASTYGGLCINMAINLRQHFILNNEGYEIVPSLKIIKGGNSSFYMKFFEEMEFYPNLVQKADAVIESGLGSSASVAVALVGGINKFKDLKMPKSEIAEKAWEIEVNKLGLYGGKQDQYAVAYGGVNIFEFGEKVTRVPFTDREALESLTEALVLIYTGFNRQSAKIQEGFKKLSDYQIEALNNIKGLAKTAIDYVAGGNYKMVGELLDQAWEYKKHSNKGVTNARIDELYRVAKRAGALGGKIMGAGSGGHMLFMVEPEDREKLIKALEKKGATWVDFGIDWNGLEVRKI